MTKSFDAEMEHQTIQTAERIIPRVPLMRERWVHKNLGQLQRKNQTNCWGLKITLTQKHSLKGNQNRKSAEHHHGQQTISQHRDYRAQSHLRLAGHQGQQKIEGDTAHHSDAVNVRERDLSALEQQQTNEIEVISLSVSPTETKTTDDGRIYGSLSRGEHKKPPEDANKALLKINCLTKSSSAPNVKMKTNGPARSVSCRMDWSVERRGLSTDKVWNKKKQKHRNYY